MAVSSMLQGAPSRVIRPSKGRMSGVSMPARSVGRARKGGSVRSATGDYQAKTNTSFHKGWVLPEQLLPCDPSTVDVKEHKATVYTVRLCTSRRRKSSLSVPGAGVQLCLIGKDGRAVLQRVSSDFDMEQGIDALTKIIAVVDKSVGIDSSLSAQSAFKTPTPSAHPPRRFMEGSVDEVSFLAPDLGPLAGLLVAPEAGSWTLEEVMVVSSRTSHADRFVLRETLGEKARDSAAYLTPVPLEALIYGSGDSAKYLTKEEAAKLRESNLDDYKSTKQRLMITAAALTAGGTAGAAATAGLDAAIPFVVGGAAGVLYSLALQHRVDSLQPDAATVGREQGPAAAAAAAAALQPSVLADAIKGGSYRGALCAAAVLFALWSVSGDSGGAGGVSPEVESWPSTMRVPAWQLVSGTLGFFTYKLAVVTVSLTTKDKAPTQALQALDRMP